MSDQRPSHDQVDASWLTSPAVERQSPNALNPTWSVAFTVTALWAPSSLDYQAVVAWARDERATRYSVALQKDGEIVSSASTTDTNHVFSGLTAHTSYVVVLTLYSGDEPGLVQYQDVATGAGLPSAMDGVDYTFTESSLTPAWPAVEDADGYVVALFRDGVELDRADVTGTSATFEGLEDGTRYTLSFYAYNAQGQGPETTGYDATTAYKMPSPPSNIRQDGEMIIGISTLWDAPVKANQLHIQLFYGDQVLYDEYAPGTQTARTFPVPMASTNYLLRIRSGNPAGWSEWSETVVYTEKYPRIDSRLGVMATTYQEDVLYPDTWNGGSGEQDEGVVESTQVSPIPKDGVFSQNDVPTEKIGLLISSRLDAMALSLTRKDVALEEHIGTLNAHSEFTLMALRSLRLSAGSSDSLGCTTHSEFQPFNTVRLRYRASVSEPAMRFTASSAFTNFTKEIE